MKITKSQIAIIAIIVISFAVSIYFYPQLPDRMATHWNAKGEVDDHMGKEVGAFIMPVVMTVTVLMFLVILRIDPLKKNIEKFKSYYFSFIIAMCLFLFGIHWWMLLWNIGVKVSVNRVMPVAIGALYFFIGYIMKNFKRNWFMGIRTPWTLSNEIVWKRTHEVSGRLFMASSVIAMCGVFFPEYSLLLILVPILATAVFALVYSYVVYKKVSNAELDGTADEMRVGEGSGDTTWDNIKEGYLYQVERSLLKVKHPAKKQVLEDVRSHLDQRFSELGPDEQTWENMQAIITEMGPASDYAELLAPETIVRSRSIGLGHFWWVAAITIVVAAAVFLPNVIAPKIGYIIRFGAVEPFKPVTAKQLLDEFNRNHPPQVRTHHFRTKIEDDKLKGLICVDNEAAKDAIVNMIDKNEKLILIAIQSATERDLERHYALGQPSLKTADLKKESVETDVAIEDIRIKPYQQGGLYSVTVSIRNKSKGVSPKFGVYFYQGDPGEVKPMTHGAGPIEPGDVWNECSMPFALKEGTNQITAIIDPDDLVAESDEKNNRASLEITVKDGRIAEETITKKPLSDFVSSDIKPSRPVDFEVTSSDFTEGDWIEITEVAGTSPQIKTGEKYTIRGKYRLASHDTAKLHIYATDGETSSSQGPDVKRGEGEFIRTFTLLKEGSKNLSYLHLSFYPAGGGSSFGNTYFKQKKAADDKTAESNEQAIRAVKAAQAWLRLIDEGDYSSSWEEAAEVFKNAVTKAQWADMAKTVRQPLGKVISRQVMSKMPTKNVPGGPDGEYVIIQFKTSFENKADAIETVTPMLDKNGIWRVSGYYIK